jgi:Arylsulfotransferase (ASST)
MKIASRLLSLFRQNWEMLSLVSGMVVLAFMLGMIVAELRLFPFGVVHAAAEAARDWRENWRHYLQIRSKYAARTDRGGGATIYDQAAIYPGHTFVTGYRDGLFHAFLITMRGTVEHEWRFAFSEAWPDPPHLNVAPPDLDVSVHGAALLPDGAVVMNFEGLGTVKLDRCSRVLWRVPAETHHAVDALPTGEFLVPAWRQLTQPGSDLPGVRIAEGGWLWEEMILRIDPQGRIVAETSLLERMLASGLEAVLYANGLDSPRLGHTEDPLHLNDVEMLREDMAAAFPLFTAGDVMVSCATST